MQRKIIEINEELCTGCGECIPNCAEGSLQLVDGKVCLVADKLCDGLGACLGHCPVGALSLIEREAENFDEEAVQQYLSEQRTCPCPGQQMQFNGPSSSFLTHWPVQIRLIPSTAPFLENCELLIAADCTAVACASLQQDFIQGRVVMMGCPKFDDQLLYKERFSEIFRTQNIRSVTLLIMEVPCCASLVHLVKAAYREAQAAFPLHRVLVSTQGEILLNELIESAPSP
jgi:NAD-dependent dihydropyrimidine dehydrogenase PreA subunit